MTRANIALDRLHRHSTDVLRRRDRGIVQAENDAEADRRYDRREAYRALIAAEMANVAERLKAQERHAESLASPNRKQHKKRRNNP